jgi:hypothetical protein
VTKPGATQFPGWPITIRQEENYGRKALAWLPRLQVNRDDPVVQVIDEYNGEVVYTWRINGRGWSPKVFRRGTYTVRVWDGDRRREFHGVEASLEKDGAVLRVDL